jgi:N-acetylneuraminic acid mutarotase
MNAQAHEFNWQQLQDMPAGKWEPASLLIDGKLYVVGGYADHIMSSKRVDVFDPVAGTWTRLQDLPSALSHVNLVPGESGFWFAGGMKDKIHPAKDHIISEVWHYNIELDRYSAAPLLPGHRAGGGLARIGDNLHYISGLMADRDTDAPDHWILDLSAWNKGEKTDWVNAAPLPLPRNQLSVAVLNGKIYVIGGQLNHDKQQLDQKNVDIYDPGSDTWSEGPSLPYGHSHAEGATFVHNNRIWMIAGHHTPDGGKKGFSGDVLTLEEGGEWQVSGTLPKPVSSPAASIIDNRLYVAGGWDGRMEEDTKKWLSSPEVWVTELGS